jgi:hypothetical protein
MAEILVAYLKRAEYNTERLEKSETELELERGLILKQLRNFQFHDVGSEIIRAVLF